MSYKFVVGYQSVAVAEYQEIDFLEGEEILSVRPMPILRDSDAGFVLLAVLTPNENQPKPPVRRRANTMAKDFHPLRGSRLRFIGHVSVKGEDWHVFEVLED